ARDGGIRGRLQHRVVLAVVGEGGRVRPIGRDAVVAKVDTQAGVGEDGVFGDLIARSRGDGHASAAIEGDAVPRAVDGPANRVVRRGDEHAGVAVAQGGGAGDVGADQVALDHVAAGACVGDLDAVGRVTADDVAGQGAGAADGVAGGGAAGEALLQLDAHAVAQRLLAGPVGADEVALDHVPGRGPAGEEVHARHGVAADDVAGAGGG